MTLVRNTIENALKTIRNKRIVVIGDMMLDRYVWGTVNRISPEAPVPIVEVAEDAERPGGAGNVALNLTSMGAKCSTIGLIGDDRHGETMIRLFHEHGVETDGMIVTGNRPTTVKTRIIADDQQVVRIDREKAGYANGDLEATLIAKALEAIKTADAVILEDYNKGVLTKKLIRRSIDTAIEKGIPVTVDPKRDHFFDYYGATLMKPNLREAEGALTRPLPTDDSVEKAGRELLVRLQSQMVLITRGSKGMSLFGDNATTKHIPTRARTISDVSGAGDTVISTMTLGLVAGLSGYEASVLATKAAGYVIGQIGVVPITPEALLMESMD